MISILDPNSYAIYSRTLKLVQLLYIVQTRRNILKLNRNSHTHLTETPSLAWYAAAALKAVFHFHRIVANRSVFYCVHIISSA